MLSFLRKNIAEILYSSLVFFLILFCILDTFSFGRYSDLINAIFTATFVYLTYKTLRQTIRSEIAPYLNLKIILASKVDETFLNKFPELKIDSHIRTLITPPTTNIASDRNFFFVWLENLGEQTAIEVSIEINYKQTSFGRGTNKNTTIPCGALKKGESYMALIDKFDSPKKSDELAIENVFIKYTTANAKAFSDSPKKYDLTKSIISENSDDNVLILFKTAL